MSDKPTFVNPSELPAVAPCRDCGREHVQGDHVVWTATDGSINWEGCATCWVKRTNPKPQRWTVDAETFSERTELGAVIEASSSPTHRVEVWVLGHRGIWQSLPGYSRLWADLTVVQVLHEGYVAEVKP